MGKCLSQNTTGNCACVALEGESVIESKGAEESGAGGREAEDSPHTGSEPEIRGPGSKLLEEWVWHRANRQWNRLPLFRGRGSGSNTGPSQPVGMERQRPGGEELSKQAGGAMTFQVRAGRPQDKRWKPSRSTAHPVSCLSSMLEAEEPRREDTGTKVNLQTQWRQTGAG